MRQGRAPTRLQRLPPPAELGLAAALVASTALLLVLDSRLAFVSDDWDLVVRRPLQPLDAVLEPFHEHIVIAPALLYRGLLEVFGMTSALPFYALSIALFATTALLLFVYLRRRVGDGLALAGALLVLFLGAAAEDLLWAFQMGFFGSTACGIGMLVALDRGDQRGDRVACALLTLSICFSSLGISFALGALVDVLYRRGSRLRRAYVALAPLALYAVWWLGWGHTAESHLGAGNLPGLPLYVLDSAASGLGAMLGFSPGSGGATHPDDVFRLLLVAAALALGARGARSGRLSRGLAVTLAIALSFWLLAGLNRDPLRFATSSRYQYPSVLFLLLVGGEALRGVRLRGWAQIAVAAVTCLAVAGGIRLLANEYSDVWKPRADKVRATLAAVEVGGERLQPGFRVGLPDPTMVRAQTYLTAASRYGSAAPPVSQLDSLSRNDRATLDRTLAQGLGLSLAPAASFDPPPSCRTLTGAHGGRVDAVPFGKHVLVNRGPRPARVRAGRYADGESVPLGTLRPETTARLDLPPDGSTKPWRLSLAGPTRVDLC